MLAWIRHRPSRTGGFTSVRTMGASTRSIWLAEKSWRSSMRARRCQRRRPSRRENSSSDRKTASCSASADSRMASPYLLIGKRLAGPKHACSQHPEPVVIGKTAAKPYLAQRNLRHEIGLHATPWPVSAIGQDDPALTVARSFHYVMRIGRGLPKPQRVAIINETWQ